jgi:hypothetical protein
LRVEAVPMLRRWIIKRTHAGTLDEAWPRQLQHTCSLWLFGDAQLGKGRPALAEGLLQDPITEAVALNG